MCLVAANLAFASDKGDRKFNAERAEIQQAAARVISCRDNFDATTTNPASLAEYIRPANYDATSINPASVESNEQRKKAKNYTDIMAAFHCLPADMREHAFCNFYTSCAPLISRPLGYKYLNRDLSYDGCTSFNPSNSNQIVVSVGSQEGVVIWDIANNQPIRRLSRLSGSPDVNAWSPNGRYIAFSWQYHPVSVYIYDTEREAFTVRLEHTRSSRIQSMAFTPDSQRLVTSNMVDAASLGKPTMKLRLWSVATGGEICSAFTLEDHADQDNNNCHDYSSIAMSHNGIHVAVSLSSWNQTNNLVQLWDIEDAPHGGKCFVKKWTIPLESKNSIYSIEFNATDDLVMVHERSGLKIWNIKTQKLVYENKDRNITMASFDRTGDGIFLVNESGCVEQYKFSMSSPVIKFSISDGYTRGFRGSWSADKRFVCVDTSKDSDRDDLTNPRALIIAELDDTTIQRMDFEDRLLINEALETKQWNDRLLRVPLNEFEFMNLTRALGIENAQAEQLWLRAKIARKEYNLEEMHPASLGASARNIQLDFADINPAAL